MKSITVSAPACIRIGDKSAYLNGQPTLYVAINQRVYVTLEAGKTKSVISPQTSFSRVNQTFKFLLAYLNIPLPHFTLTISSPVAGTLDQPVAEAVALCAAVTYFVKNLWNPHAVNLTVYEMLKPQGGLTGGEVTVTTFGGFVWERRELSYLNSIWQLSLKITPALDHFYLIRQKTSTNLSFPRPRAFLMSEELIKQFAESLKKADEKWLSQNLQAFPVGDRLYLCYAPNVNGLKSSNVTFEKIHLGEEGVRIEQKK